MKSMNQRENMLPVHRSIGTLLLLLCVSLSGCAVTNETGRVIGLAKRTTHLEPHFFEYVSNDRLAQREARLLAEQAWAEASSTVQNITPDYENGFTEGFADYLYRGGSGEPPLVPPRGYWALRFLNPQGQQSVEQWFAGFRHGAQNCKARGIREMWIVPTSYLGEPDPPPGPRPNQSLDKQPDYAKPAPPENETDDDETSEDDDARDAEDDRDEESSDDDDTATSADDDGENDLMNMLNGGGDDGPESLDRPGSALDFLNEPEEVPDPGNANPDAADGIDPEDIFVIPGGDEANRVDVDDVDDFNPLNFQNDATDFNDDVETNDDEELNPFSIRSVSPPTTIQAPENARSAVRQASGEIDMTQRPQTNTLRGKKLIRNENVSPRRKEPPMKLVVEPPPANAAKRLAPHNVPTSPRNVKVQTRVDALLEFDDSLPAIPLQVEHPRLSAEDLRWDPMDGVDPPPQLDPWDSRDVQNDSAWSTDVSADELPMQMQERQREMPRVMVPQQPNAKRDTERSNATSASRIDHDFLNFEDESNTRVKDANAGKEIELETMSVNGTNFAPIVNSHTNRQSQNVQPVLQWRNRNQ